MQLRQMQALMLDYIACGKGDAQQTLLAQLRQQPGLKQRLSAYRDSRGEGLVQHFIELLPASLELIGEDCFRQIILKFVSQHFAGQSVYDSINNLLPEFVDQLLSTQESLASTVPYLADLMQFELALHCLSQQESLFANQQIYRLDCLNDYSQQQQLTAKPQLLSPAFLFASHYKIWPLWRMATGLDAVVSFEVQADSQQFLLLAAKVMETRLEYHCFALTEQEYQLCQLLQNNQPNFETVFEYCEGLALGQLVLESLITQGVISGFTF